MPLVSLLQHHALDSWTLGTPWFNFLHSVLQATRLSAITIRAQCIALFGFVLLNAVLKVSNESTYRYLVRHLGFAT